MLLYKFGRGSEVAITRDSSGKNLPGEWKDWKFLKSIAVHAEDAPRIGASAEDIIKGVMAHGFYVWTAKTEQGA